MTDPRKPTPSGRVLRIAGLLVLLTVAGARAAWQDPVSTPAASDTPDADTDVLIEHYRSSIVVAQDGTMTRDTAARLRVATSDGLLEAGTLRLPFERDLTTMTMRHVRVRKADGTVIETPIDSAIDVPSDVTRDAPAYTDLYERHINVRGLAVGDVVEYDFRSEVRPLIPGHFALEEEWLVGEAVVDGEITLSAPTSLALRVTTYGRQPDVAERDGRTLYRWAIAHPAAWTEDEVLDLLSARLVRRSSVQATTFASWEAFGASLRDLWRDRTTVTPALREKALALVSGRDTDAAKIAAIYDFVSRDVRYIAVSFGIGRLQPHAATDVLNNGFGDCKDKHVLLEALLRAVGIESAPVLVAPLAFVDTAVPSPLQFTHVITRVETSDGPVWLDGTVAPAPAGYLPFTERDRDGLLIAATGPASLVRTPSAIPRESGVNWTITGTLDAHGVVTARFENAVSGDPEFALRTVLRPAPEAQRTEVLRRSYARAFGGTVTDIALSDINDVSGPLVVSGSVTIPDYSRWASGEVVPLMPPLTMPDVPTGRAADRPLDLGFASRLQVVSRLRLPAGFEASIDGRATVERSVANVVGRLRLVTTIDEDVLVAEGTAETLAASVPPSSFPEYAEYRTLATAPAPVVALRDAWPWNSVSGARFQNPEGQDAQASQLVAQAMRSSPLVAVGLLQKAVAIEPAHPTAWSLLGEATTRTGRLDEGERIMRRQIEVAPSADAYKRIGTTFMSHLRWGVAAAAFREGIATYPDDRDMPALLGEVLINDGQASAAVPVLEAEVERRPRSSRLRLALGRAYLRSGRTDEGVAALHAAVEREAGPNIWGVTAHELAGVRRDLPQALAYAEGAVRRTLAENESNEFTKLGAGAADATRRLAFYYEALGRVLLAQEAFDRAAIFCRAAWDLAWRSRAAECLAGVARATKDAAGIERYTAYMRHATSFYAPAGAWDRGPDLNPVIPTPPAEARANFEAYQEIDKSRSFTVPRPAGATGRGSFELITGPNGAVREARMFSSAPQYEALVGDFLGRVVGPVLPEEGQARLLRIARVICDDGLPGGTVTTSSVIRAGDATIRQQEVAPPVRPAATCTVRME